MVRTKTLAGFKRFKSKKNGKDYCVATILNPYPVNSGNSQNYGCEAEAIFLPDEYYNYLTIDDIGKSVTTSYDVVGGRAYLREFSVDRTPAKAEK